MARSPDAIRTWYAEAKRDIGELKDKKGKDAIRTWYAEAKAVAQPLRGGGLQMQSARGTLRQRLCSCRSPRYASDAIRAWYAEAKVSDFSAIQGHQGCNPRVVR